jgi:hypothetical protein
VLHHNSRPNEPNGFQSSSVENAMPGQDVSISNIV